MRLITCIALAAILLPISARASTDKLVIHEWGTFTSLQDEAGRSIGGINNDDEPLPKFVHDLLQGYSGNSYGKGLPGSGPRNLMQSTLDLAEVGRHHGSGHVQTRTAEPYFDFL